MITPETAIRRLDKLTGNDSESDHAEADSILLASLPADVRRAYQRLQQRAGWWAHA